MVTRVDLRDVDRAVAAGRTDGWAEVVADPRWRNVGATVVGPSASETVGELAALVARRARLPALYSTVHLYPTYGLGAVDAVGEHLQARLLGPATRRFTRPLFGALRALSRA